MENRGNWTDLIAGVGLQISEVFDQGQEEYVPGIFALLTKGNAPQAAQKNLSGKTGAGKLVQFDDGDDIGSTKRYKTYLTKVVYNNYGQSIEVTKNTIEDRDFASELDEMKDLSIAANFSQDESGLQLLNGGFATTAKVRGYTMNWYGDGVATFSTVHPSVVPGASTQSNASATGIKFGHDNLEVGKVALVEQATDDGLPIALMGRTTVSVPPALEREVLQEINTVLEPATANNTINVYKGNTDVVMSIHLATAFGGSDTAWFLSVPGRDKMYHEVRQEARLEQEVNIKNKVVTYTVDARWANYVKDFRRKWASKGDLATYSG